MKYPAVGVWDIRKMSYKVIQLGPNNPSTKYGFPHAIEFSYHEHRLVYKLEAFCKSKFGRDYRPHHKRPEKNAKWYKQGMTWRTRICFKTEHMTTLMLMQL